MPIESRQKAAMEQDQARYDAEGVRIPLPVLPDVEPPRVTIDRTDLTLGINNEFNPGG